MKNIPQAYRPSYLWFWPQLILGGSVISAGTIHDLRRVKVPGTGPLWNPWICVGHHYTQTNKQNMCWTPLCTNKQAEYVLDTTIHKQTNTICIGHHYTHTNKHNMYWTPLCTNKHNIVNKTWGEGLADLN